MPKTGRSALSALLFRTRPAIIALTAAMLVASPAHAADFGHSRLVSSLGQPLRIDVPITGLSAAELASLVIRPAPASAWAQAGLKPPVALDSLKITVADGPRAGTRIIQVR